jgi:desumoylating isopeptidase 1
MFLVGKGIPENIRTLPERFLNTPFGQMMKPQIDGALRGFTQGGEVNDFPSQRRNSFGQRATLTSSSVRPSMNGPTSNGARGKPRGVVLNVTTLKELDSLLAEASKSCAVIFFTSATCPPCKIIYPAYDDLADEFAGKATLIKVDTTDGYDIARKYGIRATPTFITFLKGEKDNEWLGANDAQLRGNVRLLVCMAFPPHPHTNLTLPSFRGPIARPVTYKKVPPLEKLVDKIGPLGKDPAVASLVNFVRVREKSGPAEASIPDLRAFSSFIAGNFSAIPKESHFAVIDLTRFALADPRVSSFFVEEKSHATITTLLSRAKDIDNLSYNLRVVTLQLCCNLFTSPLYLSQLMANPSLRDPAIALATACLSDTYTNVKAHTNVRVLAASWIYNLAASNHNERIESRPDILSESDQVELVAALIEAIRIEKESVEALHGFLFALGLLVYMAPVDGEVWELCKIMDLADTVVEKGSVEALKKEPFLKEVGGELLRKGLA